MDATLQCIAFDRIDGGKVEERSSFDLLETERDGLDSLRCDTKSGCQNGSAGILFRMRSSTGGQAAPVTIVGTP